MAIGLNFQLVNAIKKITAQLKIINIDLFYYLRINADGKFLLLANSEVVESSLGINSFWDFCITHNENLELGRLSIIPWQKQDSTFLINSAALNMDNGISIVLPVQGFIEIYSFATINKRHMLKQLYINNPEVFKQFIIYFKIKAKKIIDDKANYRSHVSRFTINYTKVSSREQQYKIFKQISVATISNINLTPTEQLFLENLLDGKSYRDIAKQYNISMYQVKKTMNNLMVRARCLSKTELLTKLGI